MTIKINNQTLDYYGLTPLQGTMNALFSIPTYKAMPENTNVGIDGTMLLTAPTMRKVAKRDFILPFMIEGTSFADLYTKINSLRTNLVNGRLNTGVNQIQITDPDDTDNPALNITMRCAFVSMDSYNNFPDNKKATLHIKFTEINPNNR